MNAADRKKANSILSQIEELRAQAEALAEDLRELADAEQEKLGNMPDGIREGERGQAMEEAADNLSSAADALESGNLEEALESLGQIEGMS